MYNSIEVLVQLQSQCIISIKINSDFYIVIYPWPETLEYGEEYFSWQNFAFELCEFSKCKKLISAFPEFKKVKKKFTHWKKEIYFLNDIHFNVKGNRILADIIYHEALKHQKFRHRIRRKIK